MVTISAIDKATTELAFQEFGYPNAQTVEISKLGMEQCLDQDGVERREA